MELLSHWQHFFFYGTINSRGNIKENPDTPRTELIVSAEKDIITKSVVTDVPEFSEDKAVVTETEQVILKAGKTLRILAEEKLGNREFWTYIYLRNQQKIKNPNVVPIGTELIIPHSSEYDMNPNDVEAVEKAKKMGNEILKKMGQK